MLETGPADGPPIILLHGWGVSAYLWRANLRPLAAAGYRVIAIDLPGHGLSEAPKAVGSYTTARFVEHLRALYAELGISRAVLIGQSMAGRIAVEFAAADPAAVSHLLLFGPVGFGLIPPWQIVAPIVPRLPGRIPSLIVPRRVVDFVQRRVYGKLGWFTERDVDEYWAPTQFPDVVRAQLQMLREFDWLPHEPARLEGLTTPTLVVFGTQDRTVRPVHAERLVRFLPAGQLEWIEGGGHVVMEEAPDRINALILDYLSEQ